MSDEGPFRSRPAKGWTTPYRSGGSEHSDPDDILRAKQLASNFIGPCAPADPQLSLPVELNHAEGWGSTEKYTDSVRLLDAARQKHVHSVYGDRVDAMKADLLRLFRLRSFDG